MVFGTFCCKTGAGCVGGGVGGTALSSASSESEMAVGVDCFAMGGFGGGAAGGTRRRAGTLGATLLPDTPELMSCDIAVYTNIIA